MIMLLIMKPSDKNIESEIVQEFEKIRPAITRLLQSQTENKELIINLGKCHLELLQGSPIDLSDCLIQGLDGLEKIFPLLCYKSIPFR